MMSKLAWKAVVGEMTEWAESLPASCSIAGSGTKSVFDSPPQGTLVETKHHAGIIEWDPDDLVVVAWAGTTMEELQAELAKRDQCLPLPQTGHALVDGIPGTVGGLIGAGLTHGLREQMGAIRDWVLGLAVIRSDGTLAKCGSKAVKSVAGYDIHRFMCGSRGRYGLTAAAAMRVYPIGYVPVSQAEVERDWSGEPVWIQRVLPVDFESACRDAEDLFAADPPSGTLWHGSSPNRVEGDWVVGPGGLIDPTTGTEALQKSANQMLDPHGRFC